MLKRVITMLLILFATFTFANPIQPELKSNHYITIDYHTGEVIQEKDADKRVPIASVTKVMTAYVVFKELKSGTLKEDELVSISEEAWKKTGSKMFIEVGKQVSIEDLLTGLLVQSGNDAAVAIAEHIGGSVQEFAKIMNHYAQEIGMTNSVFKNPTGLHEEGHLSTARDISILARKIIQDYPEYYHYFSIPEFTFNNINQKNRNKLIHIDKNKYDGFKTGWHTKSGYCLLASAKHSERRVIMVVLDAPSTTARFDDAKLMANYGLRFYENFELKLTNDNNILASIPAYYTDQDYLDVTLDDYFLKTLPKDESKNLNVKVDLPNIIYKPVKKDQVIGKVKVYLKENLLKEIDIIAINELKKSKGLKYWSDYIILNWIN